MGGAAAIPAICVSPQGGGGTAESPCHWHDFEIRSLRRKPRCGRSAAGLASFRDPQLRNSQCFQLCSNGTRLYSITSSALTIRAGENVSSIALAVLRLMSARSEASSAQQISTILPADPSSGISLCAQVASASGKSCQRCAPGPPGSVRMRVAIVANVTNGRSSFNDRVVRS